MIQCLVAFIEVDGHIWKFSAWLQVLSKTTAVWNEDVFVQIKGFHVKHEFL